jgi:hypothetical protein
MSLGFDIAVGGLVSLKLRMRVLSIVFRVSQNFKSDKNEIVGFETCLAEEMVNQALISPQTPAREKKKKKQKQERYERTKQDW